MISDKASTAFATIGTVCWCVQLIPQIIYNFRRKDCTGFPPSMMFLWVLSGIPFAVYFMVTRGNVILQVQPHLFMFFCGCSWVQSMYYPPVKLGLNNVLIKYLLPMILVDVGFEVGFTLWLRPVYDHGTHWPALVIGIIATILLAAGLIPPYFELAKRNGRVVGINFIFLFIDSLGAWFSIISVVLGNMDVMGMVLYAVVAVLEIGIFLSQFIWCCRFKWFGNSSDDIEEQRHEDDEEEIEEVEDYNVDDEDEVDEADSLKAPSKATFLKDEDNFMQPTEMKTAQRSLSNFDDQEPLKKYSIKSA